MTIRAFILRTFACLVCALVLGALCALPAKAADSYKLAVGDTVLLSIAGLNVERRMTIGVDGMVNVPLIGEVKADGKTISELLEAIKKDLPSKSYTLRTPDGRDAVTIIAPDEIGLSVAEYRPVYVTGDVVRPGEVAYKPGMTLRQAVSLAGGYDIVRFRIENPAFATYDLLAEYRQVWLDRARTAARIAWLASALGQTNQAHALPIGRDLLSDKIKAEAARAETDVLESKAANFRTARENAQRNLTSAGEYVRVLEQQLKTEEESAKVDAEESDRIADLFRRGTVPATRLAEARRLTLLSATRVLQVASQLEMARRTRLDSERDLRKLDEDRRTELLTAMQENQSELRRAAPHIDAVWEKLRYITALRSQLVEGGSGGERQISLVRRTEGKVRTSAAEEDVSLEPGDVVEVRLRIDYEAGMPFSAN
ncbi:polysaccharide biosynthesis/export family protein [Methylobacterium sp. ID0610]|uniref:polysaccharide biosynthesis/export family protein n=1 Tax=Methylobacterium carpenticola TaxID=3344827 RepID=UPI0036D19CBD